MDRAILLARNQNAARRSVPLKRSQLNPSKARLPSR